MAGDGASIGTVYVDVMPSGEDFFQRFVQRSRAQGARAGDELGNVVGKPMSDRIAAAIADGVSKGARGAVDNAARAGEQAGARYGELFKARVETALKGIPDAKIGLDSGQVARDLAVLRAEMDKLRSRDLEVRVDVTKAYVDVVTLREELAGLGRQRPTVRADVDTAGAMAQTALLIAELERLGSLNPTVRPDVDDSGVRSIGDAARSSSSGISLLAAAGTALGPAIIPVAAAAAAAVAAIGAAGIGAIAGLGVTVLGISGVVGAVKAMGAAEDAAGKDATTAASRQSSLAGAIDGVRSAQASLANTQASAADSIRRASESVTNAERAETDANRQLLIAQQAMTQARIDAARAAEDLSSRVAHNSLDQRQAALDEKKALDALNAAKASSGGNLNAPSVVEAQLAYDQIRQRVKDLGTDQQRLAADKAKSDKAGIDGSTQVVAAQEKIRQATENVAKAEQGVTDARIASTNAARQAAFSIEQAQQGVVNAQRAVQQASAQAGSEGSAAMTKLQQAMDGLSPAGQRFATFIFGLKPEFLALRAAAEGGLLPGFEEGIRNLLPVMPDIISLTGRFAAEVGHLAAGAGAAFAAPYWRDFFRFLGDTAIPAMDTFAHIAYNMALGLSGILRAGAPLGNDFASGLLRFSEAFAAHALTIQSTQGYRDFLNYVHTEGPIVARTIGEVVTAVIRLVEAIAPVGGVSLTAIRLLAETINALPIPVLTVLAGTIVAVVTATKLWGIANTVLKSSFVSGVVDVFSSAVQNAKLNMFLAEGQTGKLGTALFTLRGAASGAGSAIGSMVGAINPIGAALAVAAIGFTIFAQKAAEQKAAVDGLQNSLRSYADTLKNGITPESVRAAQGILQHDEKLRGLVDATHSAGISQETLVKGLNGDSTARNQVIGALNEQIRNEKLAAAQARGASDSETAASKAHMDRAAALEVMRTAFAKTNTENSEAIRLTAILSQESPHLSEAQRLLGDAMNTLADKTATAADKANALRAADEAVFGAARLAIRSEEDQAAAEDKLAEAGKRNADAHIYGKDTLDLHTEAGRNNRRMLEDQFLALGQEYLAEVQAGVSVEAATKKHDENTQKLVDAAKAAGLDTAEVAKLRDTFGTLPTDPKVQLSVIGVDAALTQLENLEIAQLALRQGLQPAEAVKEWKNQHTQATQLRGGLATGGPVFGAGTETSDSIPAWLSNNEHVWTAAEVKAAGGHAAVEAMRQAVLRGFAGGGAVNWPFPTTAAMTKIPSLAEARQTILNQQANLGYGPIPGNVAANLRGWIDAAVQIAGVASSWAGGPGAVGLWTLVMRESGGSPTARNDWDINAQNGVPSQGLAQVIPPTFAAYRDRRLPNNILDPVANLVAALNYIKARYGCMSLDALILTRRGWLKHDEVQVGDETIAYNPETRASEWTKVIQVHHYEDAPVVRLHNADWSVVCTPNHRWVSETRIQVSVDNETFCQICGDNFTSARGAKNHTRLAHGVRVSTEKQIEYRPEFVTTEKIKQVHQIKLAARAVTEGGPDISEAEAELLGWVAGDGTVRSWRVGGRYRMTLYQAKPDHVRRIQELVEDLPHNEAVYEPRRVGYLTRHEFQFGVDYTEDLLERSGYIHGGPEKFVLSLNSAQRAAWLRGVIGAEGHRTRRKEGAVARSDATGWSITQANGPVLEAIKLAVYLEGNRPAVSALNRGTDGRQPSSTIVMGSSRVAGGFLKQEDAGQEEVWCVTTELGSWTAQQDGRIFLTGNSIFNVQQANPNLPPQGYATGGPVLDLPVRAFDTGYNVLEPGLNIAWNGTGRPEPLTADLNRSASAGRGGNHIPITVYGSDGQSPRELAHAVAGELSWSLR